MSGLDTATAGAAATGGDPERRWVSYPSEWQPLFRRWAAGAPGRARLHAWPQRGGQRLLALTLLPRRPAPVRLLVAVPHAHEPACTAAAVDLAGRLLTGAHLDGTPAGGGAVGAGGGPPVSGAGLLVTLLPDGNPQGRARSPRRCWDGTDCDNETLWRHAFGVAADGGRFGRYPEWRWSQHRPRQVGLVYEQVTEDLYVEPNTSRLWTYARAIDDLHARYRYTHMLEMHQHEWAEAALLPADFEALDGRARRALSAWGRALIAAWRDAGIAPRPPPGVPYAGQPRQQLFRAFWADRCPGMLRLGSEVRNNRLEPGGTEATPLARQLRAAVCALDATLAHLAATG